MESLDALKEKLPEIRDWVSRYVKEPRHVFRPLDLERFRRLPLYFSRPVLERTMVAVVERMELPPFRVLGPRFAELEELATVLVAVNYEGRVFILRQAVESESAYILPLVRTVQWEQVGSDLFLLAYFGTLAKNGYRWNPFIEMAHRLSAAFDRGEPIPDLEERIRRETLALVEPYRPFL